MKFKIFLCVLLYSILNVVSAQNDSSTKYATHLYNLQYLFSPSINFDQGKNVIALQIGTQFNPFKQLQSKFHLTYSTYFKNHCFGLFLDQKVSSQTYLIHTRYGFQYAYAFTIKKSLLGKDVKLIPGISWSNLIIEQDFNKLTFGDQIDDRLGFVNPTAERQGLNRIKFPTFDLSLLIRQKNYFVSYLCENLIKPTATFYFQNSSNEYFRVSRYHQINLGYQILSQPKWNLWALADIKYTDLNRDYIRFGLSAQVFKYYFASVKINDDYREIGIGIYRPRFRLYAKYQNTPNPYFNYFSFGSWSAGIIKSIGKQ